MRNTVNYLSLILLLIPFLSVFGQEETASMDYKIGARDLLEIRVYGRGKDRGRAAG